MSVLARQPTHTPYTKPNNPPLSLQLIHPPLSHEQYCSLFHLCALCFLGTLSYLTQTFLVPFRNRTFSPKANCFYPLMNLKAHTVGIKRSWFFKNIWIALLWIKTKHRVQSALRILDHQAAAVSWSRSNLSKLPPPPSSQRRLGHRWTSYMAGKNHSMIIIWAAVTFLYHYLTFSDLITLTVLSWFRESAGILNMDIEYDKWKGFKKKKSFISAQYVHFVKKKIW